MTSMIPYTRIPMSTLGDWFGYMNDLMNPETVSKEIAPASMQMDVEEKDDGYEVSVTLPGVKREEIDVELNEGHLNISVDKKDSEEVAKKNYIHRETSAFRAMRSVYLKDADTTGLAAQLKDGVLTISVPKKRASVNVQKIEIA